MYISCLAHREESISVTYYLERKEIIKDHLRASQSVVIDNASS